MRCFWLREVGDRVLTYDGETVADVDGHGVENLLFTIDDLADGVLAGGASGDVGLEVTHDGDGHVGAAAEFISSSPQGMLRKVDLRHRDLRSDLDIVDHKAIVGGVAAVVQVLGALD